MKLLCNTYTNTQKRHAKNKKKEVLSIHPPAQMNIYDIQDIYYLFTLF